MGDLIDVKALVVDDSLIIRRILQAHLEKCGVQDVDHAGDGYEALSRLQDHAYHLLLLDWSMPRMNGLQVLKLLRSTPGHNQQAFVMMVTAESHADHVLTALRAGADDYVIKPFTAEILEEKIRVVLEKNFSSLTMHATG